MLAATECTTAHGQPPSDRLEISDYSKPSTEPRPWVFDLSTRKLLYQEWVAHGRNTGDNLMTKFSNAPESRRSSLGLFARSALMPVTTATRYAWKDWSQVPMVTRWSVPA